MENATHIDRRSAPRANPIQDLLWDRFREVQFEAEQADRLARDTLRDRGLRDLVERATAFRSAMAVG